MPVTNLCDGKMHFRGLLNIILSCVFVVCVNGQTNISSAFLWTDISSVSVRHCSAYIIDFSVNSIFINVVALQGVIVHECQPLGRTGNRLW